MNYNAEPPRDGLRLHLNENTAGCSPAVLAALRAIERTDTAFYPDYGGVTTLVERTIGVPAGWVQLTNGLDEGLHVAAQAAARGARDPATVIIEPAFEMYAACADAAGLRQIHIPPPADLSFPLDDVLRAVDRSVGLVSVTDPGNPTGLPVPTGAIATLAEAAPHALVFVDEAYADFSGRTAISWLDGYRNVVVGRTFAKAYGLAALRVGALIAHPDTLARFRRLLPPYSLNIAAVRALEAALGDRAYLDWYVRESVESRQLIYDFCRREAWTYWPSEANFVLVRVGDSSGRLVEALGQRGIFVRDKSSAPGCTGCVRITAGVAAHTRICIAAMEDLLASRQN
jgi:histidinol-phosphate aminotransferase